MHLIKIFIILLVIMTIFSAEKLQAQDIAITSEQRQELIELTKTLSPGDMSTLALIIKTPEAQMGTSASSPNNALFMKMAELGLAEKLPTDPDLSPALAKVLISYKLTPGAENQLKNILIEGRPEFKDAIIETINSKE